MSEPKGLLTRLHQKVRAAVVDGDAAQLPRLANLVTHFFDIAGGEREVAQMMYDTYHNPATSAMVRAKIMSTVLDATRFAETRRGDDLGDLSDLSAEDLDRLIDRRLQNLADGERDGPADGQP